MRTIVTDRVALSVGLSVGRFVTILGPAKVVEPVEVPFGVWTWVGQRNHVLYIDWNPDPVCEGPILRGGAAHCKV